MGGVRRALYGEFDVAVQWSFLKVVDYEKQGKGHVYFPILKKQDYSNQSLNKLVENYFQGSFKSMVSFFVKKNDIDIKELENILNEINKNQ